jgi:hypothetical protein
MAAIESTDVTVTISDRDKDIGHGPLNKNITIADVAFGDDALTYPTGGIPLPTIGNFGYQRQIDFGAIEGDPDDGFVYKYDRSNHKIKIFTQGVVTGSTAAASTEAGALAENSAGAEVNMRLSKTAVDTTYDLGAMIELPNTIAPAATALRMLLLGE